MFLKKDFKKGILNDHVFITHAVAEESVRYYCKKMKDKLPHGALKVTETGSVISAHCGPGTIGITYIVK
ncbi:MAG: DegV family protein [Bacilli bacterium]|nr:DegV family protein [Bacilli bacterium]